MKSLKCWCIERSAKDHITPNAVWYRIKAGKYPKLKLKRKSRKVVLVLRDGHADT